MNMGPVKNLHIADSMTVNNGVVTEQQTSTRPGHQASPGSSPPINMFENNCCGSADSLAADGSVSNVLSHQGPGEPDDTMLKAVPEPELQAPVQEQNQQQEQQSQERGSAVGAHQPQHQSPSPAPVPCLSGSRNDRGHDRIENIEGQGVAANDPTAMHNLKGEQDAIDVNGADEGEGDDMDDTQDDMEILARSFSAPAQSTATEGPDDHLSMTLRPDARPNIPADGSEHAVEVPLTLAQQTDTDPQLGADTHNRDLQFREDSSLASPVFNSWDSHQSIAGLESSGSSSLTMTKEAVPPLNLSDSSHSAHGFSDFAQPGPLSLLTSSRLSTDGGSRNDEDRFIIHHRGYLLQNESRPASVIEFVTPRDIIQKAEHDGCFAGPMRLLKAKWLGLRRLCLTRWRLYLKSETADIHQYLCHILLDTYASTLKTILTQLKQDHSVYLQEIRWDEGLVIHLGHSNPQKRKECMQPTAREKIQDILHQLLPLSALMELSWQQPVKVDEEEVRSEVCIHCQASPASEAVLGAEGGPISYNKRDKDELSATTQKLVDCTEKFAAMSELQTENQNSVKLQLQNMMSLLQSSMGESGSFMQILQSVQHQMQMLQQQELRLETKMLQAAKNSFNGYKNSEAEELLHQEQARCLTELQQSQKVLNEELENIRKQQEQEITSIADLQKVHHKFMDEHKETKRQLDQELLKTRRDMDYKLHKMQEEITKMAQSSKDIETGKDLSLQVTEEEIRKWGTKFKAEGQRALETALQQMKDISLQRRELDAQRDHILNQSMQNFNDKLSARITERERRIQTMADNFHSYLCQRELDMKAEQQAILMDMYKLKKEYTDSISGRALALEAPVSSLTPPSSPDPILKSSPPPSPPPKPDADGSGAPGAEKGYKVVMALHGCTQGPLPQSVTRGNQFSSALAESAQTTSRILGKHEFVLDEKIHLLPDGKISPDMAWMDSASLTRDEHLFERFPQSEKNMPAPIETPAIERETKVEKPSALRKPSSPEEKKDVSASVRPAEKKDVSASFGPAKREAGSATVGPAKRESIMASETPMPSQKNKTDAEEDLSKANQFLDWVNVYGNLHGSAELHRNLSRSVNEALKPEVTPAPRAKCLDTILCLDVSDSIVKDGYLEAVKSTALRFVDGIEDLISEVELEENIAVVVMGDTARVLQHLTNDLTLVRDAIESLNAMNTGGRSPFMQALLVCLAANKGRGGVVNVSGYKIRPRIIFISDGCPTDEAQAAGPDLQSNVNQVKFTLVQVLSQLASKKQKTTPRPIHCIPVGGKPDQQFLQSMAELGGGQLVPAENIKSLCLYYKKQQTIGRLYKMVKNHDYEDDKIREVLKAIAPEPVIAEEEEAIVAEIRSLKKTPPEEEELDADDFNNVLEIQEKVKKEELLALGTRVVRGPDWGWNNQDSEGPGTVIQHSKKDNWIYVKWDKAGFNAYRYNEDGKFEIVETHNHPRNIPADSSKLEFGVRVVRGPDWKMENVDDKGPGTVIRVRDRDGKVKVRWDKTGKIFEHHYSETKGKEVRILNLSSSTTQNAQPSTVPAEVDNKDKFPVWQWRDYHRQWRLYKEEIQEKLETEFKKRPSGSCVVNQNGSSGRVNFKTMEEKAVEVGSTTEVKREMVSEETKNDLLAIELSLQSS